MTTQFYKRPAGAYTGEAGLPNRTKYYTDSTSSPKVPISSQKIDGDINYLVDAVNELYDTAVTGTLPDNAVTNAKLRDSTACSVIGRSANSSGDPADIVAATNDTVLVRKANTLAFGSVPTAGIDDGAITTVKIADTNVTFGKVQNVNSGVLIGRSTSGAGSIEQITVGSGLSLSAGTLTTNIPAASDTTQGLVELATSAEAAAGTDTARAITPAGLFGGLNATGTAPIFAPRAWVNFNGTGTVAIRGSGNVSSITDNGPGDYTVNFTTALPDANYVVMGFASSGVTPGCVVVVSRGTTGFRFTTRQSNNPVVGDFDEVHIVILR